MTKKHKTIFDIFLQSIGLYFSNADRFLHYMAYPVFGQLIGGIVIFHLIAFYDKNLGALLINYPVLNTSLYKNLILFVVLMKYKFFSFVIFSFPFHSLLLFVNGYSSKSAFPTCFGGIPHC